MAISKKLIFLVFKNNQQLFYILNIKMFFLVLLIKYKQLYENKKIIICSCNNIANFLAKPTD